MNPFKQILILTTLGFFICLFHFAGAMFMLLLMLAVLSDLYGLMDNVADHAEQIGLMQANLRELHRFKNKFVFFLMFLVLFLISRLLRPIVFLIFVVSQLCPSVFAKFL